MRVSEAIKSLTDILSQAGDLDVITILEHGDHWCLDSSRQFDVVGIPNQSGDGETLMCAFLGTELLLEPNEDEKRPRLALVKKETDDVQD